jgi:hypothetical protein
MHTRWFGRRRATGLPRADAISAIDRDIRFGDRAISAIHLQVTREVYLCGGCHCFKTRDTCWTTTVRPRQLLILFCFRVPYLRHIVHLARDHEDELLGTCTAELLSSDSASSEDTEIVRDAVHLPPSPRFGMHTLDDESSKLRSKISAPVASPVARPPPVVVESSVSVMQIISGAWAMVLGHRMDHVRRSSSIRAPRSTGRGSLAPDFEPCLHAVCTKQAKL